MLRLRRGLTIANKSFESNRRRNTQSSRSKSLDCIRTIPQIRRKPNHELNGERIQKVFELLCFVIFHCVKNRSKRYLLSDLIVSLVENSLIVTIVYKTPNLKKPINYFIANMAFSDILSAIFWMPLNLSLVHTNSLLIGGQLGQALCKLVFFFGNVSLFVSIQNLILIAVDRYGAVGLPLRSPLIRSKLSPFFILATWIVAVAISSLCLIAGDIVDSPGGTSCVMKWEKVFGESLSSASIVLAHDILHIYIPVLLLAIV